MWMQGTLPDGRIIRAKGRNRGIATRALVRKVEREFGVKFQSFCDGGETAEFVRVERFAELPEGDYDCVCFPTVDGRIICECKCPDKSRCQCNRGVTTFSERNGMRGTTSRRRHFDEGDDPEELRRNLLALIKTAPPELLQALGEAASDSAEDYVEGSVQGGGHSSGLDDALPKLGNAAEARDYAERVRRHAEHARQAMRRFADCGDEETRKANRFVEKFNEARPRSPLDSDLIREGFEIARKYNPGLTFEEFCQP